jgi:SAM-dependent methyltransferase
VLRTVDRMNDLHLQFLATDEWRQTLEERALPFAFGPLAPADLGDDVVEIGPGPGLTTDLLRTRLPAITAVELDPDLAAALAGRMAGRNVDVVEADATAMPFEDGRFSGAVTFTMLHHVPTAELQDRLFADIRRVLRPGGLFVANDSVASEQLAGFHHDDVYNPVDPATLEDRLHAAGFTDVDVRSNEYAWACHARRPSA